MKFFVPGVPAPKGSARAFVIGGRAVVTAANKATRPWEQAVKIAAWEARDPNELVIAGAVEVEIEFLFLRKKGDFNAKGAMKPSAPRHHVKKPDSDKLLRCALDALTGVLFFDDAQVISASTAKRYCQPGEQPGCYIELEPVE